MMGEICAFEKCCGCSACEDVCPNHCIKMILNPNGFFYPSIDDEKCCNCGICKKICPENEILKCAVEPQLYAAYAIDEYNYKAGSSGGIFGLIGKSILSYGGKVYGAAFDESLNLCHIGVKDEKELSRLFKSKYIQSNTSFIFRSVLKDLYTGKPVLFSGTPCQCAALRKYLRKDYDNLLIVDILCHGVPSMDLWQKSLKSYGEKHKGIVTDFQFRSKPAVRKTDHYFSLVIKKHNGKEQRLVNRPYYEFPFYYHYTQYCGFRETCYDCEYANTARVGDITLADFWKLDRLVDIDSMRFASAVITNTIKGTKWFEKIKTQCWCKPMPITSLISLNPTYTKGTEKTPINQQSLKDLSDLKFSEYEKKYMVYKKDIVSRGIRFIKRILLK